MNEPIISPWVIYFIGKADSVIIGSIMLALIAFFFTLASFLDDGKTIAKVPLTFFLLFLLIAIIVPSEETCYKMLFAKIATRENIGKAFVSGKNVADYFKTGLIEVIKEVKE